MLLKNGRYDTNTEMAQSFRDNMGLYVIVYRKIEK
jgi:hypothetical protein